MQIKKQKSEKQILQEGFLTNFLGGVLAYGFLKGSDDRKKRIELTRSIEGQKKDTTKQMKKDDELKRLLLKFSSTSSDLFSYVKRKRKDGDVYERLYQKLAEFY